MSGINVDREYDKFPKLKGKREEVLKILNWVKQQPHLPSLSEWEVIVLFYACHYSTETTKQRIDLHYTMKTHAPEIFENRDVLCKEVQQAFKLISCVPLKKRTPEGHVIIFLKLLDFDSSKFYYLDVMRQLFICLEFILLKEGIASGHKMVIDMSGSTFGHITRIRPLAMKKVLLLAQDAPPIRTSGLHFVNIGPVIDKLMILMKPFIKNEFLKLLHLHSSLESFYKFVPREILPQEYGGDGPTIEVLTEEFYKEIKENREYFLNEEKTRRVNEQLRPGKPKNASDLFGAEGNFKQLVID